MISKTNNIFYKIGLTLTALSMMTISLLGVWNTNDVLAAPGDEVEETVPVSDEEPSEDAEETELPEETENSDETEETEESEETEPAEETEETEETSDTEETEETEESEEDDAASGIYDGITIDGDFDDWESVVKHNGADNRVNACGMVWDGDYLYLLIDEAQQNSGSWAGPRNNGNFVIRTDLEEVMIVTLTNNGAAGNIVSVTIPSTHTELTTDNGGLQVAINDDYATWGEPSLMEIAIPTASIPDYLNTISFGYYLGDTIIADVANLNPDPDHNSDPNDGSSIVIDGDYHDWTNYPVTTIEYDTSGTSNNYADAKGAIYSNDGTAYVYGVTNNFRDPNHWAFGNQFLEFTVMIGGRQTKMFAVLINDDGSLDWEASRNNRHYSAGTYHFALFEQSGSAATRSLDNIAEGDIYYGDLYLTVGDYQDRTELQFDIETVAEYLGVSAADAGSLKVRFHRIGDEVLETSGISTGPIFVLFLAWTAAGSYYVINKKKKKTS